MGRWIAYAVVLLLLAVALVLGKAIEHEYNLGDLLRRPDVSY